MTAAPKRTSYREVFAEPVFRVLFATRTLAIAADTLRIVALSILVYDTTGSALLGAIAFGVGFLPQAVGGVLLGSLSDRLPPRTLITAGYALECAAALLLGLVHLPAAASLLLVAFIAVLTPAFNGASARLVADRLHGDAYVVGRSLSNVASAGAQLVGLAAGGAAVAALGAQPALLVTAGGHLVAALGVRLFLPRLPRPAPATGSAVRQSWTATMALFAAPDVRRLLAIQWLPPTFAVGAEALIIPYATLRGFSPSATGLLLAAAPLGMLASGLIVGRLIRPAARERLVGPLIGLIGVGVLVLLAPLPIGVAIAGLFCVGFGFAYSLGVQRAFLEALPVGGRGQAFAVLGTGLMTMQGLGPLMAGALAEYASIPAALVACGAATIATATIWAILHRGRPPAPPITPAPQQLNADVPPGGGAGVASRASSEDTLPARSAVTP